MTVYERIRKLCKIKKVSVAEMERSIGISKGATYKWKTSDPSMDMIKKLSSYFETTPENIMYGSAKRNEPDLEMPDDGSDEKNMNMDERIQSLIDDLTGDNSAYCYGQVMSEEGKLALINSLKQDKEFLTAMYKNTSK